MMKLLYEAANSVDAHMIANLLDQAGISSRIDGEFLQGGAGELQAFGVVRVMVDEEVYPQARSIIESLEESQPTQEYATQSPAPVRSSRPTGLVGFFVGVAVTAIFYHHPVTEDGLDYNDDGWLDEKWVYVDDRMSTYYKDRNFDKEYDLITSFDHRGLIKSEESDEDFNGTFETRTKYFRGNAILQESDADGDGFYDRRTEAEYGQIRRVQFYDPAISRSAPVKIQYFGPFSMEQVRMDTNGDGVLDTTQYLDSLERPMETVAR